MEELLQQEIPQLNWRKDAPGFEEAAALFWASGILVLRDFFDSQLVERVAKELEETVADDPVRPFGGGDEYGRRFETKVRVWSANDKPACCSAMEDENLAQITEAICGSEFQVASAIGIFSTPFGCGQGWHQDSASQEPGQYELNRILYPTDVRPEQGCLVCVPGSHIRSDLPAGENHGSLPGECSLAPSANTLVLMHSRCYHRVEPNGTETPRTQLNSRARPSTAPEDVCSQAIFRTGRWNFNTSSTW